MTGTLTTLYESRIGEPVTRDEAYGYWLFFLGAIAGVAGILLFLTSAPATTGRLIAISLAAAGLALVFAGPVVRLPLRPVANYLTYLGLVVAAVAILWLVWGWPGVWSPRTGNAGIVGLYTLGMALIAAGGVVVPLVAGSGETPTEAARREAREADLEASREALADAEADEADLAVRLRALRTSQARFELYEDAAGEWRWRLRHRNGNVVADSGEGYTRKHDAQRGMGSVRRNALGATTLLFEREAELPAEDEEFEPVDEVASQATFELYEDAASEHRWRLRHDNGEVLADGGEGYAARDGARTAIDRVRKHVGPADYLRFDPAGFEVYRDRAEEWRWRLVHRNGEILADGGQGYTRRNDATRAVERVRERADELELEVYEDDAGEYRWRLLGDNGRILADSGEGYAARDGAEDAVERLREYAPDADVLDVGQAAFELYEDAAGEHRWRLRHRNGNVLMDSGEGYADRSGARDGIETVKRNAPNAGIEESES